MRVSNWSVSVLRVSLLLPPLYDFVFFFVYKNANGNPDIVDGKLKLILGLIWTLILRYQINVIGEGSPKWELLEWVRKQVEPYNIPKPLRNFTTEYVLPPFKK